MSNELVQFREVHVRENGASREVYTEYRVREAFINLGLLTLSDWSPWRKWGDLQRIDQNGSIL